MTTIKLNRLRPKGIALLGLLALAFLQVSAAGHQFEHGAGDFSKACRICVQYERQGDALSFADAAPLAPALFSPDFCPPGQEVFAPLHRRYDSRAPPVTRSS